MREIMDKARAAKATPAAASYLDLASACLQAARRGDDPLMALLALSAVLSVFGRYLDDRPVASEEVERIASSLSPLLSVLTSQAVKSADMARQLEPHLRTICSKLP